MMAHDSRPTPERRRLSDTTVAELRHAILQLWASPLDGPTTLGGAMDGLVREARDRSLRAEEVLVEVKGVLASLPELDAPERRMESVRFREQLITRCIQTYYAGTGKTDTA
jgi:tetrahydromethanopterin S-methyltransferase subunit F